MDKLNSSSQEPSGVPNKSRRKFMIQAVVGMGAGAYAATIFRADRPKSLVDKIDTPKKSTEAANVLKRKEIRIRVIGFQIEIMQTLTTKDFGAPNMHDPKRNRVLSKLQPDSGMGAQYEETAVLEKADDEVHRWMRSVVGDPGFVITDDSVKQAINNRKKVLMDELTTLRQ